jgi:hypothetical protein
LTGFDRGTTSPILVSSGFVTFVDDIHYLILSQKFVFRLKMEPLVKLNFRRNSDYKIALKLSFCE